MSDLISRQVAIDELVKMLTDCFYADEEELDAVETTLKELPSESKWTPIKYRPMDEEERRCCEEDLYKELSEDECRVFDCPMPEDGQEILISYESGYVSTDICYRDGCELGLEENGDWEDIIAWMPLPKAYKGE